MEIGLTAPRTTIGSPFETPAVSPPALFERWIQRPASPRPSMTSWTCEPKRRVCSKPSPSSTPLTMLMLMTAAASAASRRRSQWTYDPSPMGTPVATTSNTPPTVSPASRASSMRAIIAASASGSGQRRGDASASSRERLARAGSTATPPTSAVNDHTSMPSSRRNARATPPAATRAAVSRADARSSTLRTSSWPYLSAPARSPWPGRTRVTGVDRLSPPSAAATSAAASSSDSGSTCMTFVQFSQSLLATRSRIGEPSVRPCRTPATISARSCSICWRAPRP